MMDDIDRDICNTVKNRIIDRLTSPMLAEPMKFKKEAFYDPGWRLLFRMKDTVIGNDSPAVTIEIKFGRDNI